jgi:predicted Zn-dependent protease with MMP-like domain
VWFTKHLRPYGRRRTAPRLVLGATTAPKTMLSFTRRTAPPAQLRSAAMDDRHARHRRSDADRRRRPVDGFRARDLRRFERLVDDAVGSLPGELLDYLDNVQITIEDVPPADPMGEGDELLLGLYQGIPRTERELGGGWLPDRITLFRRPLEARARTKRELADIVRETVVHEIAHHFGIDDDRLDELGWG